MTREPFDPSRVVDEFSAANPDFEGTPQQIVSLLQRVGNRTPTVAALTQAWEEEKLSNMPLDELRAQMMIDGTQRGVEYGSRPGDYQYEFRPGEFKP